MTKHKYRAKPQKIDGIRFASKAEAKRYNELKLLERAGEIKTLTLQPKFPMFVNGQKVCTYIADFEYVDVQKERRTIEDVKGMLTPIYRLKRKLFDALYPDLKIIEVRG